MQGREHFDSTNIFSTRDEWLQFSPPFVNLEFYNFALQKNDSKTEMAQPGSTFSLGSVVLVSAGTPSTRGQSGNLLSLAGLPGFEP